MWTTCSMIQELFSARVASWVFIWTTCSMIQELYPVRVASWVFMWTTCSIIQELFPARLASWVFMWTTCNMIQELFSARVASWVFIWTTCSMIQELYPSRVASWVFMWTTCNMIQELLTARRAEHLAEHYRNPPPPAPPSFRPHIPIIVFGEIWYWKISPSAKKTKTKKNPLYEYMYVYSTRCTNLFHPQTDSLTEHTVLCSIRIHDLGSNTVRISRLLNFGHQRRFQSRRTHKHTYPEISLTTSSVIVQIRCVLWNCTGVGKAHSEIHIIVRLWRTLEALSWYERFTMRTSKMYSHFRDKRYCIKTSVEKRKFLLTSGQ